MSDAALMVRPTGADDLLHEIWLHVVDVVWPRPDEEADVAALTRGQKTFFHLWNVDRMLFNGGGVSCVFNYSGRYMHEALEAARSLGASFQADVLREMIALFPGQTVPKDADRRREALLDLSEDETDQLYELGEAWCTFGDHSGVSNVLLAFVEENTDEFFAS